MITNNVKAARVAFEKAVETAQAALKATTEYKAFEQAREELRKFDEAFSNGTSTTIATPVMAAKNTVTATATVTRKGKKTKAPKAVPVTKTRKAARTAKAAPAKKPATNGRKPGPKSKKKAAAKEKPGKSANPNAVAGLQAWRNSDRPPLKEAMVQTMGDKEWRAGPLFEALERKGWAPHAANPPEYIGFMFSKNKETFENISRGVWRVRPEVLKKARAPGARSARKAATTSSSAEASAPTPAPPMPPDQVDSALAELGISATGVEENPFRE